MNWIKITKENIPTGEVLATDGENYIVGTIIENQGFFECQMQLEEFGIYSDYCPAVDYITHFMLLTNPTENIINHENYGGC